MKHVLQILFQIINDICKCQYAFYNDNENKTCHSDNNCLSGYPYKNPDTNECYLSLDDCLSKGNNYFFKVIFHF